MPHILQTRSFTVGDQLRSLRAQLKTADGVPIDLDTNTVSFRMVNAVTGEVKINNVAATITSVSTGEVQYNWAADDVDTIGEYWAWFIRVSGGMTEHFPAGRLLKVIIEPNIA